MLSYDKIIVFRYTITYVIINITILIIIDITIIYIFKKALLIINYNIINY